MAGPRRSLRVAFTGAMLALLTCAGYARAEVSVSLHYASNAELEQARRVASELASEGYVVELSAVAELSPCDSGGPRLLSTPRTTKAWIRLAPDPADPDRLVAFICYLGAQPLLQQAAPSALRAEDEKLAVAAAEALNGLRVRLPPLESEPRREPPRESEARLESLADPPREEARGASVTNSVSVATSIVRSFPDFPTTPGIAGRGNLGIVPSVSFTIDAFVPAAGERLESDVVSAELRTAWIRVGPRVDWSLGDFELAVAALAGPALTWAAAVASPPRQGTTDVALGAVLSLGASVHYPRNTPIFAAAAASASVLLPGARVNLGAAERAPRGYFPVDASLGLGVRWGG